MAQPLFDQHPLEQYFRNTGETAEPMPGGSPDFAALAGDDSDYDDSPSPHTDIQLPEIVIRAMQVSTRLSAFRRAVCVPSSVRLGMGMSLPAQIGRSRP
ncbi:hypothetical protein BD311DRAFT_561134 [Dichomitus squalens]|uniref:Uncharacterized protein n=1 Tax=Dichomitus squalens TaxID=114155 RepID=A0A4Q9MF33_9APHY|nr:hypothetical protein BD311DRAFT_561134 [Dichomitus squalens]